VKVLGTSFKKIVRFVESLIRKHAVPAKNIYMNFLFLCLEIVFTFEFTLKSENLTIAWLVRSTFWQNKFQSGFVWLTVRHLKAIYWLTSRNENDIKLQKNFAHPCECFGGKNWSCFLQLKPGRTSWQTWPSKKRLENESRALQGIAALFGQEISQSLFQLGRQQSMHLQLHGIPPSSLIQWLRNHELMELTMN